MYIQMREQREANLSNWSQWVPGLPTHTRLLLHSHWANFLIGYAVLRIILRSSVCVFLISFNTQNKIWLYIIISILLRKKTRLRKIKQLNLFPYIILFGWYILNHHCFFYLCHCICPNRKARKYKFKLLSLLPKR